MITFLIKWSIILRRHSHAPFAAHHLQSLGFSNQYSMARRKLPNAGALQHFLIEIYQGNNQERRVTRRSTPFLKGWSGFLTSRCWENILQSQITQVISCPSSTTRALKTFKSIVVKWFAINLHTTDCSAPGSSVHGTFPARILKWIAISYSRGSSQPKDPMYVSFISCIGRQILYLWATCELEI